MAAAATGAVMRIVILGASGQIGARVLQQLKQAFPVAEICGTTRKETFTDELITFNPFTDDWQKLGKADILINCVGIIAETKSLTFKTIHQDLTDLILQHRQIMGNARLIQISALGASIIHQSSFLRTKALADAALLKHENTVVVRPSIVCTPNTMLVQKLQLLSKVCKFTGGLLPFPKQVLQTKIQPILASDLMQLISELCRQGAATGVIEAAGKEVYSIKELIQFCPHIRKIVHIPQRSFDIFSKILSKTLPILISAEQLLLLRQDNVSESDRLEKILKRKPASTLNFWKKELQQS